MQYQTFSLDLFQEESIRYIDNNQSLIVSAPTGAGKTVIAEYAIDKALQENRQIIYTAPIKALSNQKFRDFTRRYGKKIGIMTGDVTLNGDAPVLIMTTEIFRNSLFEDAERFANVLYLIFDEVHYLDDAERGSVWEESIIFAPSQINILCLSATVPNVHELAAWIGKVRNRTVHIVHEGKRPIPLEQFCFMDGRGVVSCDEAKRLLPKKVPAGGENPYGEDEMVSLNKIIEYLHSQHQLPCLYFVFSRKECEIYAYQCANHSFLSETERQSVRDKLQQMSARYQIKCSPEDRGLGALLYRGVAYHHAGMMPALKEIVEQVFTDGLVKLLFATETFALGINMPATSVVFSALKKFDGIGVRCLKSLEYQQMSGRAGRRGIDTVGYVYANLCSEVLTRDELERIQKGPLEAISSQFNLAYSTLINLYERLGEDVIKTWDKSFGAFQRIVAAQKAGGKKEKHKVSVEQKKLIKTKLTYLQTMGYINAQGLTAKGRFARCVNGYEIQMTELFFSGVLEDCDEKMLFAILISVVYEGRKNEWSVKMPGDLKKKMKQVERCVASAQKMETMFDLGEVRNPDFKLAAAAQAWATGQPFTDVVAKARIATGDMIRTFRLAIQLGRQLRKACTGYSDFVKKIDRCLMAVNRDEVNALKQMEAFASINEAPAKLVVKPAELVKAS
jgi:superfamily II RNA helicase